METNFKKFINESRSYTLTSNYEYGVISINNSIEPIDLSFLFERYFEGMHDIILHRCTNLENIDIDYSKLENLETLHISECMLRVIPNSVVYHENLLCLDLNNNKLTYIPNLELPRLKKLDLNTNNLKELPNLTNQSNLSNINVSNNDLSNITLPQNDVVKVIDLSYNKFDEMPDLSNYSNLTILIINNNKLKNLPKLHPDCKLYHFNCVNNILDSYEELFYYYKYHRNSDIKTTFNYGSQNNLTKVENTFFNSITWASDKTIEDLKDYKWELFKYAVDKNTLLAEMVKINWGSDFEKNCKMKYKLTPEQEKYFNQLKFYNKVSDLSDDLFEF